jgi:hypothetical protein
VPYIPHNRLVFYGYFGAAPGVEQWSCSLKLGGATGSQNTYGSTTLNAIRDAWSAWHARPTSLVSAGCFFAGVKSSAIGADGKVVKGADGGFVQTSATMATPTAGASTANRLPWQVCQVGTLTTARAGSRGKGRLFLPASTGTVDVFAGTISTTERAAALTSFQTLIKDINTATNSAGQQVVVASSFGTNSLVTGVRMGLVLDTHRSRRGAILESYAALTIP